MKRISVLICALLIAVSCQIVLSEEAKISIKTGVVKEEPISFRLFGGFIEFLMDFVNGTNGMWAQEFKDRGFDIQNDRIFTSDEWKLYRKGKIGIAEIVYGGYNENGKFFQRLSNTKESNTIGIYQQVYINDTIDYDFYIYAKSNSNSKFKIEIFDTSFNKTYYSTYIKVDSSDWKKYSLKIPILRNDQNLVNFLISIDTLASIGLDEASLMQANNVLGVRKEYYDIFKIWKMGVLRYPGGTFANEGGSLFKYYIGDIDKRHSPNLIGTPSPNDYKTFIPINQRIDFGIYEYLTFCEKLGIEAQLTLNVQNEDEKVAWNWIEYCIGDSTTPNGKLRAKAGHPLPFKLKFVEIGNEDWFDRPRYYNSYRKFFSYLKPKNKDIKYIINLSHWWPNTLQEVIDSIGTGFESFSYHPSYEIGNQPKASEKDIFLVTVGCSDLGNNAITYFKSVLLDRGYGNSVKQAITEWWSGLGSHPAWVFDTNRRNSNLTFGLWNTGNLSAWMRYPEEVEVANRTNGIGLINRGFNSKNGKRAIYSTPSLWGMSMLSNYHGEVLITNKVECQKYDSHNTNELWGIWGANRIDVTTTRSLDSIYIAIISRYDEDTCKTDIIIDNEIFKGDAKVYTLNSKDYNDYNSADDPLKITPIEAKVKINGYYNLPPHSFTIIAIPLSYSSISDDIENIEYHVFDNKLILNIKNSENIQSNISIYNLLGSKVYESSLQNTDMKTIIDIQNLPYGVYLGRVNNKNFKFIKTEK